MITLLLLLGRVFSQEEMITTTPEVRLVWLLLLLW